MSDARSDRSNTDLEMVTNWYIKYLKNLGKSDAEVESIVENLRSSRCVVDIGSSAGLDTEAERVMRYLENNGEIGKDNLNQWMQKENECPREYTLSERLIGKFTELLDEEDELDL